VYLTSFIKVKPNVSSLRIGCFYQEARRRDDFEKTFTCFALQVSEVALKTCPFQKMFSRNITWEKYNVYFHIVENMTMKEKRVIFSILRKENVNHDTLLPEFGMTAGEFCVMQTLNERNSLKKAK
jgi:hypothetical protein